jgi:Gram-negative bacterial TonB protein C-terminal
VAKTMASMAAALWVVGGGLLAAQPLEPVKPHYDCEWSKVWEGLPKGARSPGELNPPRKKKGRLTRPHPNPGERYSLEGPWILSAVVDASGRVVDTAILRSASEPRWPRYEAALLKSLRNWEFAPATRNGQGVPFCYTLTVRDR